jgi:hypothetical protein
MALSADDRDQPHVLPVLAEPPTGFLLATEPPYLVTGTRILLVGMMGSGVLVAPQVCRRLDGSRPAGAAVTVSRAW